MPPADLADFTQIPRIELVRSISGAVLAEADAYELSATDSIIDGNSGVGDDTPALAIGSLADPANGYGPALTVERSHLLRHRPGGERHRRRAGSGCTRSSRTTISRAASASAISAASATGCRPIMAACSDPIADIAFTDERFGMPGYAQLHRRSDGRILEQGPGRDLMGAFGYLKNTHKWKNLSIRFREFMPVGIRPLLIPVT